MVGHPSDNIDKRAAEVIRRAAAGAESLNDLHPSQLDVIYERRWFRMFVPKEYGGLGWSLPEVLKLEEALSWTDGSSGWVVTLCSGAGWFVGFLPPASVKKMLEDPKACFAGSGAATGVAHQTSEGYLINGHWKYASGSLHATVFTANCIIHQAGMPETAGAFFFHRDEVILHPHWQSIGMTATGSHSFEVKELAIPASRRFAIAGEHAVLNDPIYQYPFIQLAETTLTANLSGMAIHVLDLCEPLFSERQRRAPNSGAPDLHELLKGAEATMETLRSNYYRAAEKSWRICDQGDAIPKDVLEEVSETSYALARGALRIVDELYPYCGLTAADPRTELNRVWRDLHTASQHALFSMR